MKNYFTLLLFFFTNFIYVTSKSETTKTTEINIVILLDENVTLNIEDSKIKTSKNSSISSVLADFINTNGKIKRLCYSLSKEEIDKMHETAEKKSEEKIINLNRFYVFTCSDSSVFNKLDVLIKKDKNINLIYIESPIYNATPGNYQSNQFYLDNSASGINATNFWSTFGNRGSGIKIVDIEQGVNVNHQDLPNITVLNTGSTNTFDEHGTAVCGEIASKNNGWGTTGIASDCQYYFAPVGNIANAITLASNSINAGDFILIEQQMFGPNCNNCSQSNQLGMVPVEWELANYTAIQTAVNNNRIIIEAAGNGFQNLDDAIYSTGNGGHYPFLPQNNSGAIMVGAGASQNGSSVERSRLAYSNYGSRVDLQGIGENVMTTGYGGYYNSEGVNYQYTSSFSGTSSASPIVTGAGILLQSKYKQTTGNILNPASIRSLIKLTGKPQQNGINPISQNIGELPDVVAAYNYINTGDNCSSPISIVSNGNCINSTVSATTQSNGISIPTCSGVTSSTAYDRWFSFVAQATSHTITVDPIGNVNSNNYLDAIIAIYNNCSSSGFKDCYDEPTTGTGGGVTTTKTFTNLEIGNTYFIRVFDYGANQPYRDGGFNICVTHTQNQTCSAPTVFPASNITQNSALITWNNVPNALSYTLRYRTGTTSWTETNNITSTSQTISPLLCNATYEWQVEAICSNGSNTTTGTSFNTSTCPNGCVNIILERTLNAPTCANGTITIYTSQWQEDYNAINNVVGGTSYISSYSLGGWITVRYGTSNGTVVGQGSSPLTWNATQGSGTYYVHYNTNSSCGTARNFGTSTIAVANCITCTSPSNLQVTAQQTTASFTWSIGTGGTSQEFWFKKTSDASYTKVTGLSSNSTTINLSDMSCNTEYTCLVVTNCNGNLQYSSNVTFFTSSCPICFQPTNVQYNSSANTLNINWTNNQSYTILKLYYRQNGTLNWTTVNINPVLTSVSIGNLNCATPYEFYFESTCSNGLTSVTRIYSTSTSACTCTPPTNLYTSLVTDNSATINWTSGNNITGVNIYYKLSTSSNYTLFNTDILPPNPTFITIFNLACNATYDYLIQSFCSDGSIITTYSTTPFRTLSCCTQPTNLQAFPNQTNATITWNNGIGANYYQIWYKSTTGFLYQPTPIISPTSTSYILNNLVCNTTYLCFLRDSCNNGTVYFTIPDLVFTTSACTQTCIAPTNIHTISSPTQSTITLGWTQPSNVTNYSIDYKKTSESQYTSILLIPSTANQYTINNLECNTPYSFIVYAQCNGNWYSSNEVFYSTASCPTNICDSLPKINFVPNTCNLYTGNYTGVTYQWQKDGVFVGSNSRFLTATGSSLYTVTITKATQTCTSPDFIFNCTVTGVRNNTIADNYSIFPNPTKNSVFIQSKSNSNLKISISLTNIIGQEVQQKIITNTNQYELSLKNLPVGVYILSISDDNGNGSMKIIKE
ncbi:MAG TPA: fibronectin type III domain-containing protein [Burkholderiales bacterium]|nr:fibronectin type III domain-containing protein [Burkholderiales bacterium]